MQINSVSNLNFESKVYRISPQAQENAGILLKLMKTATVHKKNAFNSGWQSEILSSLSMADGINFSNARLFIHLPGNSVENKKIPDFTLKMGNNTLNVNNETGEVITHKVGVFTSLSRVIKKAEKCISDLLDNFNDSDVVKKNTFSLDGRITLI